MKNTITLTLAVLLHACSLPTAKQAGLQFPTTPAFEVSDNIEWQEIGFAKELLNQREKTVAISGGTNPIPLEAWEDFEPKFPWAKNIDRNLRFQKTALLRSPGVPSDCAGDDCLTIREYQGYTWVELADPVAVDYIPAKTDMLKPDPGHLVIKTIQKCQLVYFEDHIYQLTDNKGNFYAMHATEATAPDTTVVLPTGWTLRRVALDEPLILVPFGNEGDCYYNILGDHLGQGYHQYIFANPVYPGDEN